MSSCFTIAHPFVHLGFTHTAGRRSWQSHYSNKLIQIYISSLNHPVSPRAHPSSLTLLLLLPLGIVLGLRLGFLPLRLGLGLGGLLFDDGVLAHRLGLRLGLRLGRLRGRELPLKGVLEGAWGRSRFGTVLRSSCRASASRRPCRRPSGKPWLRAWAGSSCRSRWPGGRARFCRRTTRGR